MAGRGRVLTVAALKALQHPGTHARPVRHRAAAGLYLQIAPGGGKAWLYRFRMAGRDREMGLGSFDPDGRAGGVTLAQAREKVAAARRLALAGTDPIASRQAAGRAARAAAETAPTRTFAAVAEACLAGRESGWRNAKHRAQWEATLRTFAFPVMGALAVDRIGTEDVLNALGPIWTEKPETASRLRSRIEVVLNFARSRGWREGDNPARWRGHLDQMLSNPRKVRRPRHHPALAWQAMPAFLAELRRRDGMAPYALAFAILTAARTGEARGALCKEINRKQRVWNVPKERMKSGRPHSVPLSAAALAVLDAVAPLARGDESLIFPGAGRGERPLSDMTLSAVVRRMNATTGGVTPPWRDAEGRAVVPHGFRSTFRDWAGETRPEGREVAEAALAHVIGNKGEAAYARSKLLKRRRALMEAWGEHCTGRLHPPGGEDE